MYPSPHLRVLSDANAVALQARSGRIGVGRVAALRALAAQLEAVHPVRRLVEAFALRQASVARDPAAVAEAGADLQRDVLRALRPDPVGVARVDIHG